MKLIYLSLAWAFGIYLAAQFDPPLGFILGPMFLGLLGLGAFWRDKSLALGALCLLSLGAGALRWEAAQPQNQADHILFLNDRAGQLTLEGRIIREPQIRDGGQQIVVSVRQAAGRPHQGLVLATIPRQSEVAYGDEVRLAGRLRTPPEFDTFSYADYLSRGGVYSVMFGAEVELIQARQGFDPYALMLDWKARARQSLAQNSPEPTASLLTGMLLGDDSGLDPDLRADFQTTGASHIIAISGYNMAMIALLIAQFCQYWLPKRPAMIAALLGIALYTLFVGAGAAVVRAALMSGVVIFGESFRRRTYAPTSLAFVTLLMSLYDPLVLWDIGFQLSLAAILGMVSLSPPMEAYLAKRLPPGPWRPFADGVVVTLAAQISTAPLILAYFGRLSLVSLPVNALILPLQPYLLAFGALGMGVGVFFPMGGELILRFADVLMRWTVGVIQVGAGLPWADTPLYFSPQAAWGFFVLMGLGLWYQATRPEWLQNWVQKTQWPARVLQGLALLTLILLGLNVGGRPDGRLQVSFLEVGGSYGALIESPQGASILVDGGPFPSRLLRQVGDQLPPNQGRIDVLIWTAPEEDRLAGVAEILARYDVGLILTTGQESDEALYQSLLAQAEAKNIPLRAVSAGYRLQTEDGVLIEVLWPPRTPDKEAPPSESGMVLRLTYGGAAFLLTGGIQAEVEVQLLAQPHLLQAQVLQVADQASGEASSREFLGVVNPQVGVLQIGAEDSPNATVLERLQGARLYRSDRAGLIEIRTDGRELLIFTEP
jgi:competence protein ComEC